MTSLPSILARGALGASIFLVAAAPTSCQYWGDVQVPTIDSDRPRTAAAVYGPGGLAFVANPSTSRVFQIPSGGSPSDYIPVAYATDESGIYFIDAFSYFDYTCCQGEECVSLSTEGTRSFEVDHSVPQPKTWNPAGTTVSRGRWVSLDYSLPTCVGSELTAFTFHWNVREAEDNYGINQVVDSLFWYQLRYLR